MSANCYRGLILVLLLLTISDACGDGTPEISSPSDSLIVVQDTGSISDSALQPELPDTGAELTDTSAPLQDTSVIVVQSNDIQEISDDSQALDTLLPLDTTADTCNPFTCSQLGAGCGLIDNGCGEMLDCGGCVLPNTCGGGGFDNLCGCSPACDGKECGDNKCGGSCGSCQMEFTCIDGACTNGSQCPSVPPPVPVAMEPLESLQPLGKVETTTKNGFTDDYLYDGEEYLKIGTRREWGATIIFYGMSNGSVGMNSTNVIDANDTGREVQVAFYDPLRSMQNCAWNASCQSTPSTCENSITYLGWNPVQGGNECVNGSGVEWVENKIGSLAAGVIPLHWNPDWQMPDCNNNGCSDPAKNKLKSDVLYTQKLRFVKSHIVEVDMKVENLSDMKHEPTYQEFPTLYATWGNNGTPDLRVILDSEGNQIPIDTSANDGFYYKVFSSSGGWAALQTTALDYGVGIYYENRLTTWQGWQKYDVFNNIRSHWSFGIPAKGTVQARAYLMIGSYATISALATDLDHSLPPFGVLDQPTDDANVSKSLSLAGWALDNKGVKEVRVLIDGAFQDSMPLTVQRPDVCLVYPGYSMCETVGYSKIVSLVGISACPHLLEIEALDTDGNTRIIARKRIYVTE